MFALFNPPRSAKKRKSKAKGKRKARAKKPKWLRLLKGKKLSSVRTPGGGLIRRIAANRGKRRPFLGVNPIHHRRLWPTSSKGVVTTMAKHRRGRRARHNAGSLSLSAPRQSGLLDAFKVKNLTGATPVLAGVIANGLVTRMLASKIPYTQRGIGNIALGIGTAGILGMLARHINKAAGEGVFTGGIVGTLGCAFQEFMKPGVGLKAFALSGEMDGWSDERLSGLGQFISPGQIANAFTDGSTLSQYSLPNTNANFVPPTQMQVPQSPAQAHAARPMGDYESSAIGAVLGQDEGVSGIM